MSQPSGSALPSHPTSSLLSSILEDDSGTESNLGEFFDDVSAHLEEPPGVGSMQGPPTLTAEHILQATKREYGKRPTETLGPAVLDLMNYLSGPGVHDKTVDQTVAQVCKFYLERATALHTSKAATSQVTGVSPKKLEPNLIMLVHMLLVCEQAQRGMLEKQLLDSETQPLLYLDIVRFDETPLKLTIKQKQEWSPPSSATASVEVNSRVPSTEPMASKTSSANPAYKATATSKLFATQNRYAILMKHSEADPSEPGSEHFHFQGTSLAQLQVLERTTGETIFQALLDNLRISDHVKSFPLKVRVCCTDQAGSNSVAEAGVCNYLGSDWCSLHTSCNVHKIATCHKKTFDMVEPHIAGLIHWSLALSNSAMMNKFRETLRSLVEDRLVVLTGAPPLSARRFQEKALELFGQTGTRVAIKNYLLKTWLNGDWSNCGRVEVWVPPASQLQIPFLKQQVAKALVMATTSSAFRTYPRHRWTGCREAIDQLGLLMSIHGLGPLAFTTMLTSLPDPLPVPAMRESMAGGLEQDVAGLVPLPVSEEMVSSADAFAESSVGGDPDAGLSHAELNSKYKKLALNWLSTEPLSHLIMIRKIMQPVAELLSGYLQKSGQHFREARRVQRCELWAKKQGSSDSEMLPPMLQYVSQAGEKRFFTMWQELLQEASWSWLPPACRTMHFQSLASLPRSSGC